jgi:hypothetical protein
VKRPLAPWDRCVDLVDVEWKPDPVSHGNAEDTVESEEFLVMLHGVVLWTAGDIKVF